MEQFIGVDMYKKGPFWVDDIANLPFENALSLVNSKMATEMFPIFDWYIFNWKKERKIFYKQYSFKYWHIMK